MKRGNDKKKHMTLFYVATQILTEWVVPEAQHSVDQGE